MTTLMALLRGRRMRSSRRQPEEQGLLLRIDDDEIISIEASSEYLAELAYLGKARVPTIVESHKMKELLDNMMIERCSEYDKSGQNQSKTDKTGHENEKSSRNQIRRQIHLKSNSIDDDEIISIEASSEYLAELAYLGKARVPTIVESHKMKELLDNMMIERCKTVEEYVYHLE
nr:hypothetical protein [Tanacetum cinerariifolium]